MALWQCLYVHYLSGTYRWQPLNGRQEARAGSNRKKKWIDKEAKTKFLVALFLCSGIIISVIPEDQT